MDSIIDMVVVIVLFIPSILGTVMTELDAIAAPQPSYIDWAAVLAGAVVVGGSAMVLTLFAVRLGLGSISVGSDGGISIGCAAARTNGSLPLSRPSSILPVFPRRNTTAAKPSSSSPPTGWDPHRKAPPSKTSAFQNEGAIDFSVLPWAGSVSG